MSMMLVGCQKDPIPEGDPDIKLNKTELTFEKDGQLQEVSLVSNREWKVVKDDKASWVNITPSNGSASSSPQKISVATDLNSGEERIAEITFTTGSATAKLKITQNGSSSKVYFNDFDKELAEKGSNWPYVYQTDCWHNESGSGAGNVSYVLEGNKRVSVLKHFEADSIPAYVYRLVPEWQDTPEIRLYYEFLEFYKDTNIAYLTFSKEGTLTTGCFSCKKER